MTSRFPGSEPRVKGVAFRTIDLCFCELRGVTARDRARAMMQPELSSAYKDGLLLAASWYPICWYRETFRAFRAATGEGLELVRAIGKCATRHDMAGVHKQIFAKLVSPQMLLRVAQRVFSTYYDTGSLSIVESRDGFARARLTGCIGWDASMWGELVGSFEAQLELAGAKHVRVRALSGGADDDVEASYEARWT